MSKRYLILLTFIISSGFVKPVFAQFVDNKLNLYVSYGLDKTFGSKSVNENSFIIPSLFANYKAAGIFTTKCLYDISPRVSLGLKYKYNKFNTWDSEQTNIYLFDNSLSVISSFAPVIQIGTKFKESGIYNKVSLSASLAPSYNLINVNLDESSFYNVNEGLFSDFNEQLLQSKNNSIGLDIHLQIEYAISQQLGFYFESGLTILKPVNSILYIDKMIYSIDVNVGLIIKMVIDKQMLF